MGIRPGQAKGPSVTKTSSGGGGLTSVAVGSTNTITLSGDGTALNPIKANLKVSASAGNQIQVLADGVYVAPGGNVGLQIFERNNFLANCERNLQTDGPLYGMGGSGAGGCASLFLNTLTANVTKIGTYILTSGGGQFQVGIYDNDPVLQIPRNLLCSSALVTPVSGFQFVSVPSTPIVAGQAYWIAISFDRTNLCAAAFHAEPPIFDLSLHNPFVYAFFAGSLNTLPASGSGVWSPNAAVHCIPYLNLQGS